MSRRLLICLLLALSMLATACGGEEEADPPASPTPASSSPTAAPKASADSSANPTGEPSADATASEGASSLESVEAATIQVVAEGSFVDPEFGEQTNAAGAGSGFIIDPSGIAVTNNHVVTGSATLQVFVGGSDEPLNARILGASEAPTSP